MIYEAAEKFIKENFATKSYDSRSTLDISKLVGEQMIRDEAAKDPSYYNRREGVVHVTSLTKCLRGVINEMLGNLKTRQADERQLGVFKAGNLFEDFIIKSLGDRVVHTQREYNYAYKNITLVGRSDYTIDDSGILRVGENKSVHSDSFWHRKRAGELVAWQNQVQLQVYMWLERELFGNSWEGIFSYISKDDCTIVSAPIKYNPEIIEQVVKPALDILSEAYEKRDPLLAPTPDLAVYDESKGTWKVNWICTYCDYHDLCSGSGWRMEAADQIAKKGREAFGNLASTVKKPKPVISVVT